MPTEWQNASLLWAPLAEKFQRTCFRDPLVVDTKGATRAKFRYVQISHDGENYHGRMQNVHVNSMTRGIPSLALEA